MIQVARYLKSKERVACGLKISRVGVIYYGVYFIT